jgi:hypothetical protein
MSGTYDHGLNEIAQGNVALGTDSLLMVAVDAGYTVDLSAHQNLDDIPSAARIATVNLSGESFPDNDGALDVADPTFSSVTGDDITQVVVCKDTGDEATSTLLWHYDSSADFPITPNGGDISVTIPAANPYLAKI